MRGILTIKAVAASLCCACAAVAAASPAAAQGSYSPYDESASTALARYVRALAEDPKDFGSLIGAGKAALELGDTQAAAGFFARADEVNPRSPMPQAGMGAVSVANGEARAALPYFTRAQQLGLPLASFACDRGLAYDLLGQQAQAQADYRAALGGLDGEEARRRLALSLAISGHKADALATLAPLMAKGDAGAARARAFILALSGDSLGARSAIDAAMPGSGSRVSPFLQQLPRLKAGDKAAAVNLGIFPGADGTPAYASATPAPAIGTVASASSGRLAAIDSLLNTPPPPATAPSWTSAPVQPAPQLAYSAPPTRPAAMRPNKVWLQLASGSNAEALPSQFERMKARHHDLFDGIKGFVAKGSDRARLVIGPFRGSSDAEIFAEDLESVGIDAFSWTNSDSDRIVPLSTE